MNELDLIDAFLSPFGLTRDARGRGAGVLSGPGDDCAVVRPSRGVGSTRIGRAGHP